MEARYESGKAMCILWALWYVLFRLVFFILNTYAYTLERHKRNGEMVLASLSLNG
jgi:hypothetical protein